MNQKNNDGMVSLAWLLPVADRPDQGVQVVPLQPLRCMWLFFDGVDTIDRVGLDMPLLRCPGEVHRQ